MRFVRKRHRDTNGILRCDNISTNVKNDGIENDDDNGTEREREREGELSETEVMS